MELPNAVEISGCLRLGAERRDEFGAFLGSAWRRTELDPRGTPGEGSRGSFLNKICSPMPIIAASLRGYL